MSSINLGIIDTFQKITQVASGSNNNSNSDKVQDAIDNALLGTTPKDNYNQNESTEDNESQDSYNDNYNDSDDDMNGDYNNKISESDEEVEYFEQQDQYQIGLAINKIMRRNEIQSNNLGDPETFEDILDKIFEDYNNNNEL